MQISSNQWSFDLSSGHTFDMKTLILDTKRECKHNLLQILKDNSKKREKKKEKVR
jgi:hypothetical protein